MNDQKTVRLVVGILGLIGLSVVVGGIVLAMDGKTIPDALIAIGSAAVGSVGTILAHAGFGVTVQNGVKDEDGAINLLNVLIALGIVALCLWLYVTFHVDITRK